MIHHKLEFGSAAERRMLVFATGVALFVLILDQWTKIMVEQRFMLGESITVIDGIFSLTYVTNRGAAWGVLHGYGWLLLIIGVTVIAASLRFLRYLTEGYKERYLAILLVLSGVVGNSVDRLWRGAVVDFLDFYWRSYHWPTFNIADCAICVGVAIFFISILIRPERPEHVKPPTPATER